MKYKVTMVKDGLFKKLFTKSKTRSKLQGDTFLIQLDSATGNRYRKDAEIMGKDANKYIAEILTKIKKNETK
jgi:hypothetical protein